ncbi:MAG: MFS transporter [Candidatus Aenigmatarchaeota archaeon]
MKSSTQKIFLLILFFGLISLFGDLIYESARSINGQYLLLLGATASIIGFFVGLGEFLSNFLRFVFGFLADRVKNYWIFIFIGYSFLIFVPSMFFANNWQIAILFIIFERIGKAIRNPARDTIVSIISERTKSIGFNFGIIEFLDQIGALIGPIIIAIVFLFYLESAIDKYKKVYLFLFIPFLILIFLLLAAYLKTKNLRIGTKKPINKNTSKIFWYYNLFIFLASLGFIHFAILGYHFKLKNIAEDYFIVFLYSIAMISDAIISPIIGRIYDRIKEKRKSFLDLFFIIPILSISIPFLVFVNKIETIILSMIFYGFVLGMQETIMRATIADITSISKRGSAYGIFSFTLGISAFLGSTIIGILYEISILYLFIFIVISQVLALIILIAIRNEFKNYF